MVHWLKHTHCYETATFVRSTLMEKKIIVRSTVMVSFLNIPVCRVLIGAFNTHILHCEFYIYTQFYMSPCHYEKFLCLGSQEFVAEIGHS